MSNTPSRSPSSQPFATTRRGFVRQLAGASVGLAMIEGRGRAAASDLLPSDAPAGERFWEDLKQAFPLKPGVVPMNAANLCPSPASVIDTQIAALRDIDGDVSFQNRAKYDHDGIDAVRRQLADGLGATPPEIALVRNTSEANNIIVGGITLGAGDDVVIFNENHPTNNVAWDVRAARYGFTVKRVSLGTTAPTPDAIMTAFAAAMTPRTKVLAFSHISNSSGVRLPAERLCQLARQRNIYSHVDGAQTYGALQVNVAAMGCDSFSASAHKWLCGPKEVGLLYVRSARIGELWPGVIGVGWGTTPQTTAPGARKFETLGQRDDSAIAAVGAALAFRDRIGAARIEERVFELAGAVRQGLSGISGCRVVSPAARDVSGGVVVAQFPTAEARAVFERLYKEHGIACAPTGGLRISPHIYNTLADVDRVVAAVGRILAT